MLANAYRWDGVEEDLPIPLLARRRIRGERMLLARVQLGAGCVVAQHRHDSEQMAIILSGHVRWTVEGREFEMGAGEVLHLPDGQGFSIYSLAAVLPLLAAKQRVTDANDWMSTDAEVACPDPGCPSRLRITRLGRRRFLHHDVTATPGATP